MATSKEIKRRVKSIRDTIQITKAMEMIASVKLRKSNLAMQKSRDYVQSSYDLLNNLCSAESLQAHSLIQKRKTQKIALICIASDKGLAGSFNTDIFKKTRDFLNSEKKLLVYCLKIRTIILWQYLKKWAIPLNFLIV